MTTPAQISDHSSSDRRLLPRSQVGRSRPVVDARGAIIGTMTCFMVRTAKQYRANYRFEVGAAVMWDHEEWTIQARMTSPMGRRMYTVFRVSDVRPVRVVHEIMLAPLG